MQAALKPLRLVKTKPARGLETLFQTHHARVFRTAQRITGSAADAEDVLQNVFLRLVKGQETYDLSKNPEAYLSRAAFPDRGVSGEHRRQIEIAMYQRGLLRPLKATELSDGTLRYLL